MATNIEVNGKKYFRLQKTVGYKSGKPIRKSFYGTSERDARNKYEAWIEEQVRAEYEKRIADETMTFGMRAQQYVEDVLRVSQKYSTGTKYRYERSYKVYVKDSELSDILMRDIRASDVQKYYNGLDVSAQTIRGINKFMSAFCKWAQLSGYSDNFMAAVEIPAKPENKRSDGIVIWEDSEVRDILRSLNHVPACSARHRLFFFVHVLLYTGARISEAIALKYSDFENGVVNIERQCYMGEIKEPKYGSARQIPMHHKLEQALKAHRKWHKQDMKEHHYRTDYVFTTSTGRLYDPVNIRRALRRFYEKRNIPYKHPHAYRATFCTQLCRCGVPLEVASQLMGHKSMEVTAAHYTLVRQETKREAIDKLTYKF